MTKQVKPAPLKDSTKAAVEKVVKTLIAKEVENKEVGWVVESQLHNSPITSADCYSIIDEIAQGTAGCERTGDKIKPKSLVVTGDVCINTGYNPDTRPMYVRVIIAQQKDIKRAGTTAGNVDTDHLLRPAIAGAEEVNYDGTLAHHQYPLNDNLFRRYMDKSAKLIPTSAASGFPLTHSQFRFRKVFKASALPAHLNFDAGGGDYCNNFAPFVAVGYCYADGGVPDTINQRVKTQISAKLTYEDA